MTSRTVKEIKSEIEERIEQSDQFALEYVLDAFEENGVSALVDAAERVINIRRIKEGKYR